MSTMHFEESDRPPLCEFLGYWPETIQRWYREGLAIGADIEEHFGVDKGLTPTPWTMRAHWHGSYNMLADFRRLQ